MSARTSIGLLTAAAVIVPVLASAAPAHAEQVRSAAESAPSGSHCNMDLTTGKTECFDNKAEALRAGGKVLMFTVYGKPMMKGRRFYLTKDSSKCPSSRIKAHWARDLSKIHSNLPRGKSWNNRMSSVVSWEGCQIKLYGKRHWEGHHTKWLRSKARLGRVPDPGDNWNNAATSLDFK
ncbi:MAG: hypothetical protein ACRDQA_30095 [Nocardioidaceae bacterium]